MCKVLVNVRCVCWGLVAWGEQHTFLLLAFKLVLPTGMLHWFASMPGQLHGLQLDALPVCTLLLRQPIRRCQ